MTIELVDRRQARRRSASAGGILLARIRPGLVASVVNVSPGGVLLETDRQLLPGVAVDLCLVAVERRIAIRGRVLRCTVEHLNSNAVCYRSAICFDQQAAWLAEEHIDGYVIPDRDHQPNAVHGHELPAEKERCEIEPSITGRFAGFLLP
jgi:hypothetical protein